MKLGAQFYSIRDHAQTPEGIRNCFREMKNIGYTVTQMSAIGPIEAEALRDISLEFDMPIVCTHVNGNELLLDPDKFIREHKIYSCPVIGIGGMPVEYRGTLDGLKAFVKDFTPVAKKINDAGLRFAYHNHAFEFDLLDGVLPYDYLLESFESLDFILDVYWVKYAEQDYMKYIKLIGNKRMQNIHFKDMLTEPKGKICPCGKGVIDFAPVKALCEEIGIANALVEQDNAPDSGDSFSEMRTSFNNLSYLFK